MDLQVPPIAVVDILGLPPAEASSLSAFVQSFLHEVRRALYMQIYAGTPRSSFLTLHCKLRTI